MAQLQQSPFLVEIHYDGERYGINAKAVLSIAETGLTPLTAEFLALAADALKTDIGGLITLALRECEAPL